MRNRRVLRRTVRAVGVAVAVTVHVRVAYIADPVSIRILLIRIGDQRTVVLVIGHAVVVLVGVAGIAYAIPVRVRLIRIGNQRTVVRGIRHAVVVLVGVAGIAYAIPVRVRLLGVCNLRAIVLVIRHAVVILVLVNAVRNAVAIRIRESLVGLPVTVVIQAVANLGHGGIALAYLLARNTQGLTFACTVLVGDVTLVRWNVVIGLPVAVIIHVVTGLRSRHPGITRLVTRVMAITASELVFLVTCCFITIILECLRAGTLPFDRRTLFYLSPALGYVPAFVSRGTIRPR